MDLLSDDDYLRTLAHKYSQDPRSAASENNQQELLFMVHGLQYMANMKMLPVRTIYRAQARDKDEMFIYKKKETNESSTKKKKDEGVKLDWTGKSVLKDDVYFSWLENRAEAAVAGANAKRYWVGELKDAVYSLVIVWYDGCKRKRRDAVEEGGDPALVEIVNSHGARIDELDGSVDEINHRLAVLELCKTLSSSVSLLSAADLHRISPNAGVHTSASPYTSPASTYDANMSSPNVFGGSSPPSPYNPNNLPTSLLPTSPSRVDTYSTSITPSCGSTTYITTAAPHTQTTPHVVYSHSSNSSTYINTAAPTTQTTPLVVYAPPSNSSTYSAITATSMQSAMPASGAQDTFEQDIIIVMRNSGKPELAAKEILQLLKKHKPAQYKDFTQKPINTVLYGNKAMIECLRDGRPVPVFRLK